MSDLSVTEMPEYTEGIAWAAENMDRLRERFTGTDLQTQDLRDILWGVAQKLHPEQRESMENDLKATAFVSGALYRLTQTMDNSREGLIAVSEMAMEMGSIFGAEAAKHEALEAIKGKPRGWWAKKVGKLSPQELMIPVLHRWWREVGEPENRRKTSRAEALKYVMGAREMMAFATVMNTEKSGPHGGGRILYEVEGEGSSYDMVANYSGQGRSEAGDIVG